MSAVEQASENGQPKTPASQLGLSNPPQLKQPGVRSLALPQNFHEMAAVKTEVMIVPVRKPSPQMRFCPHTDPTWRLNVDVVEIKEDGEHDIERHVETEGFEAATGTTNQGAHNDR